MAINHTNFTKSNHKRFNAGFNWKMLQHISDLGEMNRTEGSKFRACCIFVCANPNPGKSIRRNKKKPTEYIAPL